VLPAIGLGTFITFDLVSGARRDRLLEVTRRCRAAGGRIIDSSPLYGMAEVNILSCLLGKVRRWDQGTNSPIGLSKARSRIWQGMTSQPSTTRRNATAATHDRRHDLEIAQRPALGFTKAASEAF
jgi:aryl-alcohol dehydrogenase-like predicted oxidoreductase